MGKELREERGLSASGRRLTAGRSRDGGGEGALGRKLLPSPGPSEVAGADGSHRLLVPGSEFVARDTV